METLRWDSFCNFGATLSGFGTLFTNIILLWIQTFEKKSDHPNPLKKTNKKRFSRWDSFPTFWVRRLGFGIVFTNIILLCIRNFEKKSDYPNPLKIPQNPQNTLNMNLWKLCDYITFVDLELDVWNLVQCLLISFCLGSENLVQLGLPQPPKNTPKPPKHFKYELMETLRLYFFCRFGARGWRFGTVFTNIILPWIRKFGTIGTTPTTKKYPKTP